jgi:hypothetical protein
MKDWRNYPAAHRDITVTVYSKQTLNLYGSDGYYKRFHYDGSTPSGFDSTCTFTGCPTPEACQSNAPEDEEEEEEEEEQTCFN